MQKDLLNRKNMSSPREQMVERLTKNSSLVMILKVNCLETFDLTSQIKMIALK